MGRRLSTRSSTSTRSADGNDRSCRRDAASRTARRSLQQLRADACRELDRRTGRAALDASMAAVKGSDLAGTVARHPMHHLGGFFAEPRPFLPGEFVTTESGTGLVHMAPDHGEDDFVLCKAHGIEPEVRGRGRRHVPRGLGLAAARRRAPSRSSTPSSTRPTGRSARTCARRARCSAASADYKHTYPHSWRSKAKVIFRCTPQWFVPMDKPVAVEHRRRPRAEQRWDNEGGAPAEHEPRDAAPGRAATRSPQTRFVPEKGRNRIGSMVEGRPDWVLSRQRAWGVPITLFVERKTGEYLVDPRSTRGSSRRCARSGVDAWSDAQRAGATRQRLRRRRLRARHRHPRRVVRFGLHPRLRARSGPLARPAAVARPTSTSKAPTSIAAGSSPRCSKAAPPAAARRTRRC